MAPSPQIADITVQHQPSLNPGFAELPASIACACPTGTARLALSQSGLTLAAKGGEGTQVGFQFFP